MRLLDLDLDVYQGPFDLLFTLILKEEVDICEVPLVEIILAYVEELAGGDDVDWEGLSEFIVLISSLLELKSRILLPGAPALGEELDAESAREALLQRLLTYRTFKGASESLKDRLAEERARLRRPADRKPHRRTLPLEVLAGAYDPGLLRGALQRLIETRREPDTSHIASARMDLARQISVIRRALRERGRLSFEELFGGQEPMIQAVGLFALLELLASDDVRVSQRHVFGDITIEARRERASA